MAVTSAKPQAFQDARVGTPLPRPQSSAPAVTPAKPQAFQDTRVGTPLPRPPSSVPAVTPAKAQTFQDARVGTPLPRPQPSVPQFPSHLRAPTGLVSDGSVPQRYRSAPSPVPFSLSTAPAATSESDAFTPPEAPPNLAPLQAHLRAASWPGALELAKEDPKLLALLTPGECIALGKAAARVHADALAREAFRRASSDLSNWDGLQARVLFARLLEERFADPQMALRHYQEVVAAAPSSEAADFARARIKARE